MSAKNKFISKAIADGKELRESFVQSVKQQLEETTSLKIQNMIANRLNEISDEELEEAFEPQTDETLDEEFDFTSFLQEDDEEVAPEEEIATDDAPADDFSGDDELGLDDSAADEAGDDTPVSDMTKGELMALIQDAISGGSDELGGDIEPEGDIENSELGSIDSPETAAPAGFGGEEDEDDINIDELLAEIDAQYKGNNSTLAENKRLKADLKEAYQTIATQSKQMRDINLLNSKLIYTTTVLQGKTLTESQKTSVIQNIDRATSVKEAKAIFETITRMITPAKKAAKSKTQTIRESLGGASKTVKGVIKESAAPISAENQEIVRRLQIMAGIIKS